jgi:hypothetical protein
MRNEGYTRFTPGPRDWRTQPSLLVKIPKLNNIPMSPSPSRVRIWFGGMLASEIGDGLEPFEMDPEDQIPKHRPGGSALLSGML